MGVVENQSMFTAYLNRGEAYNQERNYEDSIKEFKEALKLAPNAELAAKVEKMIESAKEAADSKKRQEDLKRQIRLLEGK
jgi:tetratricopeptide (TPR) repeat protein